MLSFRIKDTWEFFLIQNRNISYLKSLLVSIISLIDIIFIKRPLEERYCLSASDIQALLLVGQYGC